MFWSRKLTAKVAISIVAGAAPRNGRNAISSCSSASATTTAKQTTIATIPGAPESSASV